MSKLGLRTLLVVLRQENGAARRTHFMADLSVDYRSQTSLLEGKACLSLGTFSKSALNHDVSILQFLQV